MGEPEVLEANSASNSKTLYTVKETAGLLSISTATIYKLFKSGQLTRLKIGNTTRVSQRGITRYVDLLERQATEAMAASVKGQQ